MKYTVGEEGISALRSMAKKITDSVQNIFEETSGLQTLAESNAEMLGPHKESLIASVLQIYTKLQESLNSVNTVSEILNDTAEGYQEIVDNDRFSSSDGTSASGSGYGGDSTSSTSLIRQTEHKSFIEDYGQRIAAVQADVLAGSGRTITEAEAKMMLDSVQTYSGEQYRLIRETYNNPNANPKYAADMKNIDDYIKAAPKWEGRVFRGINVSEETAESILSKETVDMLGPSSWSSARHVAEKFGLSGGEKVCMIFDLDDSKSGASITHIGSYDGHEQEVTAPSGVFYHIDEVSRTVQGIIEIIVVKVHE